MEDQSNTSTSPSTSSPGRSRDADVHSTIASVAASSSYTLSPAPALNEDNEGGGLVVINDEDWFPPQEIDHHHHHHHQQRRRRRHPLFELNFRWNNFIVFDNTSSVIRDDTWSCIIVLLTFWFFVSMTLILGVYGSVMLRLGPNSSILIEPNSIFVQSLKVEELDDTKPQPTLYGFSKSPNLDGIITWYRSHNALIPSDSHKEWIYYLNEGSLINISYSVKTAASSVYLVIAQGIEGFSLWLEDPTYPNVTLSWNLIKGDGIIQQVIYKSSSYYIAVGNLNYEEVDVQLELSLKAYIYNTTQACYKCTFLRSKCSFAIRFPSGDAAVLATPASGLSTPSDDWYVKVSYGPRWITYLLGVGGMTVLMLLAFNFMNKFRCGYEDNLQTPHVRMEPERAPLLIRKDEDLSSWGSSHDSSQDEADIEEMLAARAPEGKLLKDGENDKNTRHLCGICFDAPRDCFFLPCGHCVACFECGLRIVEASGTCPVCRRNMKKEIVSIHHKLSPPTLSYAESRRVCNTLALLQCVASHPDTKQLFVDARVSLYLHPFLGFESKTMSESQTRAFEYLRLTSLDVIGALVKFDNSNVTCYLLGAEVMPLCLRAMVVGSELSKTISTFIVQKIFLDDLGLAYICATAERFFALGNALAQMVAALAESPSPRLLKNIIRCHLRLTDNPRPHDALCRCLPDMLKYGAFHVCMEEDPVIWIWLQQLEMNRVSQHHPGTGFPQ